MRDENPALQHFICFCRKPPWQILSQKAILQKYAVDHSLKNIEFYVDDGYSGTSFQRPGFQRMLADVETGKIGTIITNDLSRLGRNYPEAGQYIEMVFPEYNVRYIAINDQVDTDNAESNDLMPFRNVFNEWYARDTSKKIRRWCKTNTPGAKIYDLGADPVDVKKWTALPNVRTYYDFFKAHEGEFTEE